MKEVVTVRFLGQCLPRNPRGIACYAYSIRNKEGHLLHESCGLAAEPNSPGSTNSVATYTALIKGLEWLIKNGYSNDIIKHSSTVYKSNEAKVKILLYII